MGPRLGRVEYLAYQMQMMIYWFASMGPRLGRVEYKMDANVLLVSINASMGPRLGRVEYCDREKSAGRPGAELQWGHA